VGLVARPASSHSFALALEPSDAPRLSACPSRPVTSIEPDVSRSPASAPTAAVGARLFVDRVAWRFLLNSALTSPPAEACSRRAHPLTVTTESPPHRNPPPMAATTRPITPTASGPFHSRPHTPDLASASRIPAATASPRKSPATLLHHDHLKAPIPQTLSPEPLTGAAAAEDERRYREQKAAEDARHTSPNPASAVKSVLQGSSGTMSRTTDGPPAAAATAGEPASRLPHVQIPETLASEQMQTSPTSMSSAASHIGDKPAPTATATESATTAPMAVDKAVASEASLQQAANVAIAQAPGPDTPASNRAMTFPAPQAIEQERRSTPSRGMSLPNSGYNHSPRSPSTKRHKCPFCDTDFTRHHNLKSHLLTHSQEKPYECPTCQARFRRLHDLKRHTKLHTGERPHTCPKCGRRFARGDALARHNKGPGGCAGRRSSFGIEDDGEGRGGEDIMDGVVYQGDGADDEKMSDDAIHTGPDGRRVSEPTHKARSRQGSQHYHPYSSTYPPIQGRPPAASSSSRNLYPPPSGSGPSRDPSTTATLSPKPAGTSLSSLHFANNSSNLFSQSGMTESPKPLSPGQVEHPQHGHPAGHASHVGYPPESQAPGQGSRTRSPSSSQPVYSRSSLHPHGHGPPQLPQLPGLAPAPPGGLPSTRPPNMAGGQAGSGSSSGTNQGSNGGSIRDIMSNGPGASRESDLWGYVQQLETRMSRMEQAYEGRIGELMDEIHGLRREVKAASSGRIAP
jgi:hypothetical protein